MAQKTVAISITSNRAKVESEVTQAINRALEICGGKAETYAKKRCPVNTGRLRNSITHTQQNGNTEIIGTNVEYAPYVEFGHHQEVGRFVPAIGKRLTSDYVPGKPYLKPAIEEHISEFKEIIQAELNKI